MAARRYVIYLGSMRAIEKKKKEMTIQNLYATAMDYTFILATLAPFDI